MKLNPDCIRDVLIEIEKSQKYYLDGQGEVSKDEVSLEALNEALPNFSKEDIYYTLFNLEQAGYINMTTRWANNAVYICMVNYMTFAGHEFLNSIRDPKHWGIIKKGLGAIGNFSLSAISAFAEGLGNAAISALVAKAGL